MRILPQWVKFGLFALALPVVAWSAPEPPQPADWAMPAQVQRSSYQRIARDIVLDAMLENASTFALTFYRNSDPSGLAVEQDVRVKLSDERIKLEYRLAF